MAEREARSAFRRRGTLGRWAAFFGIAAAVAIGDQVSKAWVSANFDLGSAFLPPGAPNGPTEVIDSVVRIAVSHNSGGIFGLFGASALLLGIASLAVIAFILFYQAREGVVGHPLLTIVLGLLLGGAIGNDIDRFRFQYVIDWVDMGIGSNRWYTFNVADAAISCSIVGLLILGFLTDGLSGRTKGTKTEAEPAGGSKAPKGGLPQDAPLGDDQVTGEPAGDLAAGAGSDQH